ncbi:MAG: hypothetical protein JRI68_35600, partial [Deltaproteobacteria bacterium]|nr:hypothetical protein [Deltaproteobacteria bacterium]
MEAIALDVTIPQPTHVDDEDVHWALSTATTLWSRGERVESLKWLRRAANAASDRGHDLRAVELFKTAADVATRIQDEAAAPITTPPPAPTRSGVGLRQPGSGPPPPPQRSTVPPPVAARQPDEATSPMGMRAPQVTYDDLGEVTAVLNGGEPAEAQPAAPPPQPANRNGAALRRPIRVAVVAGADGRIQVHPLTHGTRPPRGAALATLT